MGVTVYPEVGFFPGMVMPYAGSTAPDGWLLCDGQLLDRTTYAALYAVVGFSYSPTPGTDPGSNLFYLPNLKGKVIVMRDAAQTEFDVLGESGGSKTSTASHTHSLSSHTHTLSSHVHTLSSHTHTLGTHWHGLEQHLHDLQGHGHTVNAHAHGGGTGVHAHTCLNNIYRSGTPAHGHDGAGDQSSERPNVTTGFSSPGNPTNSQGQGNSNESPGTGGPSVNNTGWWYAPQGAGGPNGGSDGPSTPNTGTNNDASAGPNNNTSGDSSTVVASGNLQPYLTLNYLIKI